MADKALFLQFFKCFNCFIYRIIKGSAVKLIQIDIICSQPLQASLDRFFNISLRRIPAPAVLCFIPAVACFCSNNDVFAHFLECFADNLFIFPEIV
ncbi:Uncharacterised protein [Mycobacteroides abscessus subsp. abscessus]|nr:Uncharacterised protein [Mycobacteroides abscessus subsp. abscessus]